jgi:hypothetical protein
MPFPHLGIRFVHGPVLRVALSERGLQVGDGFPQFSDHEDQPIDLLDDVFEVPRGPLGVQTERAQFRGNRLVPRPGRGRARSPRPGRGLG